jgi:hypothetical protein
MAKMALSVSQSRQLRLCMRHIDLLDERSRNNINRMTSNSLIVCNQLLFASHFVTAARLTLRFSDLLLWSLFRLYVTVDKIADLSSIKVSLRSVSCVIFKSFIILFKSYSSLVFFAR